MWAIRSAGVTVNGQATTVPPRLQVDAQPQFAPSVAACLPDHASTAHAEGILTAMADGAVRVTAPAAASGLAQSPPGLTNWQAALTPDRGEVLGTDW